MDSIKLKEFSTDTLKKKRFEWPDWLDLPDFWYDFKKGVKNLYKFFWVIWKWRSWDNMYNVRLFSKGVEEYLEQSQFSALMEVDETRLPKEEKMKRVIEIIKNIDEGLYYYDKAEEELGEVAEWDILNSFKPVEGDDEFSELVDERTDEEKEHSRKVYRRSEELEQEAWDELWEIVRKDSQGWWN